MRIAFPFTAVVAAGVRCCVLFGLLLGAPAPAFADIIVGSDTGIESDAVRMISYRHQEHAWQTSDGATHFMVNRGSLSPGASLTLYSTFDQGQTYSPGLSVNHTNGYASSDGLLVEDQLFLAFSTTASTILFAQMNYEVATSSWSLVRLERVFKSEQFDAVNPGIVMDRNGDFWCAFVTKDKVSGDAQIRLAHRAFASSTWTDTSLGFGAVDSLSLERSARPMLTPTGIGMVYSVHQTLTWAARDDTWPPEQAWTETPLFVRSTEDLDPYASHFSVARDSLGNLHMALADQGRLRYFHFSATSEAWTDRLISFDISASYPQVAVNAMSDVVMIWTNTAVGNVKLSQSTDHGVSFTGTDLLIHPFGGPDVSYQNPRVEAPSSVLGPVLVVQQYVDGDMQKLLGFVTSPMLGAP